MNNIGWGILLGRMAFLNAEVKRRNKEMPKFPLQHNEFNKKSI